MDDRESQRPGHVTFTRDDTNESISGTLEMDDEPLKAGTPPTKAYLFDNETQAKYPAGTEYVNQALRILASAVIQSGAGQALTDILGGTVDIPATQITGGVKIITGTYVGTGLYGAENACRLSFDFEPMLVVIRVNQANMSVGFGITLVHNNPTTNNDSIGGSIGTGDEVYVTWSGNDVSWYSVRNGGDSRQCNEKNHTYHYVAIGV